MTYPPAVFHVAPEHGMWAVRREGGGLLDQTFTKQQAVEIGRRRAEVAPSGRVVVHGEDGTIEAEHTFGSTSGPAGQP